MPEVNAIRGVREVALHIDVCGAGCVENEFAADVLEELNERIGGYWEVASSNDRFTYIKQAL